MSYSSKSTTLFPSREGGVRARVDISESQVSLCQWHEVHCGKGTKVYVYDGMLKAYHACTCVNRWNKDSPLRAYLKQRLHSSASVLRERTTLAAVLQQFGDLLTGDAVDEKRRLQSLLPAGSLQVMSWNEKHALWCDAYDVAIQTVFGPHIGPIDSILLHTITLFKTQWTDVQYVADPFERPPPQRRVNVPLERPAYPQRMTRPTRMPTCPHMQRQMLLPTRYVAPRATMLSSTTPAGARKFAFADIAGPRAGRYNMIYVLDSSFMR
jgi:hypothetical protein